MWTSSYSQTYWHQSKSSAPPSRVHRPETKEHLHYSVHYWHYIGTASWWCMSPPAELWHFSSDCFIELLFSESHIQFNSWPQSLKVSGSFSCLVLMTSKVLKTSEPHSRVSNIRCALVHGWAFRHKSLSVSLLQRWAGVWDSKAMRSQRGSQ